MASSPPPEIAWAQSRKKIPGKTGFLDLPRELRDLVYEFTFRVSGAIFIYSSDPYHVRRFAKAAIVRDNNEGPLEPQPVGKAVPIAVMRVCRQMHSEGSHILYGRNTFRLYESDAYFAPRYHHLIRHIVFNMDSMNQKIFDDDLEIVGYWWRRHFWPDILAKCDRLLQTFQGPESLRFAIKSSHNGEVWRPAFMASQQKTREQRIALAAAWLRVKCPFGNDRLRECLQLEIVPPRSSTNDACEGSRLRPEDEWDCAEFAEAFRKMKVS